MWFISTSRILPSFLPIKSDTLFFDNSLCKFKLKKLESFGWRLSKVLKK